MQELIKSVIPPDLQIEATVPADRNIRKRKYVIINPDLRRGGVDEPVVVLGRLKKRIFRKEKIDYSFTVRQDELLKAFLLKEEVRGLRLVPIEDNAKRKGSARIMNKIKESITDRITRIRSLFSSKVVL